VTSAATKFERLKEAVALKGLSNEAALLEAIGLLVNVIEEQGTTTAHVMQQLQEEINGLKEAIRDR
jgi:hypothetical protein